METEAKIFKALSDPIRLKLAALLARHDEICVCKLTEAVGEPQFKVSRHLSVLRNAGLVTARRQGTWMYYSLVNPHTTFDASVRDCLRQCGAIKTDTRLRTPKC
jgi:ArsR family transcriptional regulator